MTHEVWRLDLTDDRSSLYANGEQIATIGTWMDEEKESRAYMMAAAPDMLEALEKILSHNMTYDADRVMAQAAVDKAYNITD